MGLPKRSHRVRGKPAARIRHDAKRGKPRVDELRYLYQQQPKWWDGGQDRHLLGAECRNDLLWDRRALDHQGRAGGDGAEKLVATVIKAERKQARDAVLTPDAEITGHGSRTRPEVCMRN